MKPPLQTSTLLELTRLFEDSSVYFDKNGQRLFGVPIWDVKKSTLTQALVACWSYQAGYATVFRGEDRMVELEESSQVEEYSYWDPITRLKHSVELHQVGVIHFVEEKLLHYLADLFEIPEILRLEISQPAIEETLWRLGQFKIGENWIDVWCARQLAASTPAIFQQLKNPTYPDKGLVVALGLPLPDFILPPRQYRVLSLRNLLLPSIRSPMIDRDLLHRLLEEAPIPLVDGDKNLPVRYDPFNHTLTICTRSVVPWVIKGLYQRMVVQYLYSQLQKNRRWIPAQDILSYVYGNNNYGHSRRLKDIFRNRSPWKDYIDSPQKGFYGFRLE